MERTNKLRLARAKRYSNAKIASRFFFVLAIIGFIAVATTAFQITKSLLDQSAKMEEYESFILPVVMMDPVPFNDIAKVDEQLLLQTGLWYALLDNNDDKYQYDENGMLLVPATDVEVSAAKLFGPNAKMQHHTFDDFDATYLYDPEIQAYRVPMVAKIAYSPRVESANKTVDGITLKVGYISPGNILSSIKNKNEKDRTADKYMLYELVKGEDKQHYIKAIKDLEENALPMS